MPAHIKTDYHHSHCTASSHSIADPISDVAFKAQHSDKRKLDNVSENCDATESNCKLDRFSPLQALETP